MSILSDACEAMLSADRFSYCDYCPLLLLYRHINQMKLHYSPIDYCPTSCGCDILSGC